MGAVFRAKDLQRDNKKILENAIKDLSPDTKDNNNIIKLLDSWDKEGIRSEEKLKEILGQDKAESLLKNIKAKEDNVNLTNDERKKLSNMFKESLTFD
jgi:DNA integrity scanning protein DisA with diadenylate cyclase activity